MDDLIDTRLYKQWLVGRNANPNTAPSAFISYSQWLEQRVIKLERRLADCQRQVNDLRVERDRQKNLHLSCER